MAQATIIPFPRRTAEPAPEPVAFAIGARVDLRVGALAGGVVRPRGGEEDAYGFSHLARVLRAARMAWRERGAHTGLMLALTPALQPKLEAGLLNDAALEAGWTRPKFGFELCERALVDHGGDLAEQLRACGWSIALRGDSACPLAFGARVRALFSELIVDAPAGPFLALDEDDHTPLGRRILAAKGAGMLLTAASVQSAAQARTLAIAGFDRGGGPFAEAALR